MMPLTAVRRIRSLENPRTSDGNAPGSLEYRNRAYSAFACSNGYPSRRSPKRKSLYQTLERTLCWQAPASSLDIFFNQLEDRVELNPKTTAPWRILRSLA